MFTRLGWVVLAVAFVGADEPKVEVPKLDKLQGTWQLAGGMDDGTPLPGEFVRTAKMVFSDTKYTFTASDVEEKGTIKLDPTKTPGHLDLSILEGPQQGMKQFGLYEIRDGVLRICVSMPGKERPKKIESPAGEELLLLEFKKEEKK